MLNIALLIWHILCPNFVRRIFNEFALQLYASELRDSSVDPSHRRSRYSLLCFDWLRTIYISLPDAQLPKIGQTDVPHWTWFNILHQTRFNPWHGTRFNPHSELPLSQVFVDAGWPCLQLLAFWKCLLACRTIRFFIMFNNV